MLLGVSRTALLYVTDLFTATTSPTAARDLDEGKTDQLDPDELHLNNPTLKKYLVTTFQYTTSRTRSALPLSITSCKAQLYCLLNDADKVRDYFREV